MAGVDFTTIAADGAARISGMKRILPWKYSDCSPGCDLAMELTLHLDCKFYWLCFLRGENHGPRVAITGMVASPGSSLHSGLGLFHLCFRPTFLRLFQRQCEYKLQLFVVLCLSDHDSDYKAS